MAELSTLARMPALPAGLWRVMLGTTLVVLSYSLLNPVLAVRLQLNGASSTAIGVFAMLPFISVALMVPLVPRLFARVGVGRAYRIGLLLELVSCAGYLLTDRYELWCLLGVLGGLGAAAAWNATEALIAHNVPASHRGRMTGLYQTLLGGVMALGPMLPTFTTMSPLGANLAACLGLALGLIATATSAVSTLQAHHADREPMGLWAAIGVRPALVLAAITGGVFEVGLASVTSAFGSQSGLDLAKATSLAGAIGLGSFLLQYPTGWMADHVPPRRLFIGGALALGLASLAFLWAPQAPALMWWCAGVWGAIGGSLYTLSMIRVAHDFADTSALAGTSAMIVGYTAGGALGPVVSGWMLDHAGLTGQGLWLTALALLLLLSQFSRGDAP